MPRAVREREGKRLSWALGGPGAGLEQRAAGGGAGVGGLHRPSPGPGRASGERAEISLPRRSKEYGGSPVIKLP